MEYVDGAKIFVKDGQQVSLRLAFSRTLAAPNPRARLRTCQG